MALEHGMIEPFADRQVRQLDNPSDDATAPGGDPAEDLGSLAIAPEDPAAASAVGSARSRANPRGVISYGLSSYGYDLRVSDEFKVFTNVFNTVVDPKAFDAQSFVDMRTDVCIVPPNSFALARSVEYFRIPRDILTICLGKSTYARCGIIVNVTPFEPEWEGHVTLEISNTTPLPARIYAHEGLAQVIFLQAENVCEVSYADRAGKYMKQRGITVPRL
jgi:dCTP deaminase